MTTLPSLRELPKEFRALAALVMLILAIGYAHGLGYVFLTTHVVPKGIEGRYRGTETQLTSTSDTSALSDSTIARMSRGETETTSAQSTGSGEQLQYAKSLPEMLNIIHTHILTMALIFTISGIITLLTRSLPGWLIRLAVLEPFVGIVATFAGLWGTRYVHPAFSWLVALSGALMALMFFCQLLAVSLELLVAKPNSRYSPAQTSHVG